MRKRISGIAAGCATVLVLSILPASAASTIYYDADGDAASGYDLTRTEFQNAPRRIKVEAYVVGLQVERAIFHLGFSPVLNPDLLFMARTYLRLDGSRKTLQKLYVERSGMPDRVPCAVRAGWHLRRDVIRLSVPQTCIRGAAGSLRLRAFILDPRDSDGVDWTRWVKLRRG